MLHLLWYWPDAGVVLSGLLNYLFGITTSEADSCYYCLDTDQTQVLSSHSGLLNYLFGVNREKVLTKEHLKKLQMGKKVLTSRRIAEYF